MKTETKLIIKKHIKSKMPITALEAQMLYGIPSISKTISLLRKEGMKIDREVVKLTDVVKRMNRTIKIVLPKSVEQLGKVVSQYKVTK
jgi:hypothetical protein